MTGAAEGTGTRRVARRVVSKREVGFLLGMLALLVFFLLGPPAALAEDGTCIDDVTDRVNNCAASDVRLGTFYNSDTIACSPGDVVTLYLRAQLLAGAKERYDIGLFVATDGGNARTGLCHRDYLPPPLADKGDYNPGAPRPDPPGGPFYDAELEEDPGDQCGDLEQGVYNYYDLAPLTGIETPCIDSDGDGYLDISTCVSWDNQKGNTCLEVEDAVPSTKAKCRCETITVGNVIVIPGEIQVSKVASPDSVNEPGGQVSFSLSVKNTSQVGVTINSLDDSVFGDLTAYPGTTCMLPQVLAPAGQAGDSYSCSFVALISGDPGVHEDTITATGVDESGADVFDEATAQVLIVDVPPVIDVLKTADPTNVVEPGGTILYKVEVSNNSEPTDPITLTTLADDVYGDLIDPANSDIANSTCSLVTIEPGDTYECTFEADVNGEAGVVVGDTVAVVGQDDEENQADDSDDAEVTIVWEPPDSGSGLAPAAVAGGMAALGGMVLAAGAWLRRRVE